MNDRPQTAADVPLDDPDLGKLTPRQREILLRRRTETLAQIASTEGVSRTRIRQIEQTALWKIGKARLIRAAKEVL